MVFLCIVTTWVAIGLAEALPKAVPEEVGLSSERLQRLQSVLQEYADQGRIAGGVALVARQGRLAWLEPFGKLDVEAGTPMRVDAIFRIASMSKAVTTVAVMMLHEEGRFLLSDPVSKFVPELKKTTVAVPDSAGAGFKVVPAEREITIRDLLTHTAGISYGTGLLEDQYKRARVHGWYFAGHDEPLSEAVKRLAALPFAAQPGERWVYGFNTDILGYLVEQVSGMSLDRFFRARIFEPLKMHDTHFYLPAEKAARFTPVYAATEEGKIKLSETAATSPYLVGPRKAFSGGAGLLSTASDYARFLQMLLNGGEMEGTRLLSPKSVELMTADHLGDRYSNGGFGFGFWITEDLGVSGQLGSKGAYGWGGAYFTSYFVDPREQLVAVFMSQLLPSRDLDLRHKFSPLVYQAIVE